MTPHMYTELHQRIRQRHPHLHLPDVHIKTYDTSTHNHASPPANADAIYVRGKAMLLGEGVNKDVEKALTLLTPLVPTHFATTFLLALHHRRTHHAHTYAHMAATHEQPRAWILYATVLEMSGDVQYAAQWYAKAADKGVMAAASKAGILLQSTDPTRATHYLSLAAHAGVADAQYTWGLQQSSASDRYRWIHDAARQDHAEACYTCYQYVIKGDGCLRNIRDAQKWLARAATLGHVQAQVVMGGNTPVSECTTPTSTSRMSSSSSSFTPDTSSHPTRTPCTPSTSTRRSVSHNSEMEEEEDGVEEEEEEETGCPMFHDE